MGYILAKAIREHEEAHTSEMRMELTPFNSFEEAKTAMMDELKEIAYKHAEEMTKTWINDDDVPNFKEEYDEAFECDEFYDDDFLDIGFDENSAWFEYVQTAIKWEIIYMS